jgi:integrase
MRGKYEGSVFKVGKYWKARVSLGKGRVKTVQRKTQRLALDALDQLKREVKTKTPLRSPHRTVEQLLEEFLEVHASVKLRESTQRGYEQTARVHIIPDLGKIKLSGLSRRDITHWIANLKKKKLIPKKRKTVAAMELARKKETRTLSPASIKRNIATLKAALSYAVDMEYVDRNVGYRVKGPEEVEFETHPLSEEDATRYLLSVYGNRYEAASVAGCALGLRRGEVAGLQWTDFDFQQGLVHITHSLGRVPGQGPKLGLVKSKKSRRTLQLSPLMIEVFLRRKAMQEQERMKAGESWKPRKGMEGTNFVFTADNGSVIQPEAVYREHAAALERAGISHVRFHDLRHTLGHILLANGGNLKHVSEALGHSTVQFTMQKYAKSLPRDVSETTQTMSDLVLTPSSAQASALIEKSNCSVIS